MLGALGRRETIARLLDRAGAVEAILRVRARVRAPVLTVLTYHHIAEPPDDYRFDPDVADATPKQFRGHCQLLADHFTVIDIDHTCDALAGKRSLPPNPALITFDDGYLSCRDVAVPILQDFGFSAVFFIPTRFVEERRLFWWERIAYLVRGSRRAALALAYPRPLTLDLADRRAAAGTLLRIVKDTTGLDIPRFLDELTAAAEVPWTAALERTLTDGLLMTWPDIRTLRDAGMDIQSHSRQHRVLQTLDAAALDDELAGSKADLERALGGARVRTIAYPVGKSIAAAPEVRAAVARAGYDCGFSNANGVNYLLPSYFPSARRIDPLDLHRIAIDRDMSAAMFRSQLAVPAMAYSSSRNSP